MSSEKNVFIKISMDMILKYVEISVAAKMSVKFLEYQRNTEN